MRSMQRPVGGGNMFELEEAQIRQMTMEEYCARGLGYFFQAAVEQFDENCWVLDYENLSVTNIFKVSQLFKITLPHPDSAQVQQVIRSYSKDGTASRPFESDRELKQREATASARDLARQWARHATFTGS